MAFPWSSNPSRFSIPERSRSRTVHLSFQAYFPNKVYFKGSDGDQREGRTETHSNRDRSIQAEPEILSSTF